MTSVVNEEQWQLWRLENTLRDLKHNNLTCKADSCKVYTLLVVNETIIKQNTSMVI